MIHTTDMLTGRVSLAVRGSALCAGLLSSKKSHSILIDIRAEKIASSTVKNLLDRITIEPDKRSGKACIRGMRITVYDILEYLASGMTPEQILQDFPYLERDDIIASLQYAADREKSSLIFHNETAV